MATRVGCVELDVDQPHARHAADAREAHRRAQQQFHALFDSLLDLHP